MKPFHGDPLNPMEEVLALQSYTQVGVGTHAPCFSWASVRETRAPLVIGAELAGGR